MIVITADRDALAAAATVAATAVLPPSPRPLSFAALTATTRAGAVFEATDMIASLVVPVAGAAVGRPGTAYLCPRRLLDVLGRCPPGPVKLDAGSPDERILLRPAGGARYELHSSGTDLRPPAPDQVVGVEAPAAAVRAALKRTASAVGKWMAGSSHDKFGPAVYAGHDGDDLVFASTNGERLAVSRTRAARPAPSGSRGCVIHGDALAAIDAVLARVAGGDGPCELEFAPDWFGLGAGRAWVRAALRHGRYADWQTQVRNADGWAAAVGDSAAVASAVRACLGGCEPAEDLVRVGIAGGLLTVSAAGKGGGTALVDVPLDVCPAGRADVTVNGADLVRFLGAAGLGPVELCVGRGERPMAVRAAGFRGLLFPWAGAGESAGAA